MERIRATWYELSLKKEHHNGVKIKRFKVAYLEEVERRTARYVVSVAKQRRQGVQ